MARQFFEKNVILFVYTEGNLLDKISMQPMVQDQAARLFVYNAGADCTKDPPRYLSPYRMKACADEEHVTFAIDTTARLMTDADTGIFISGRNKLLYKDLKKQVQALKPRVGVRELEMEPSESEYMMCCRVESNASGSLDICDQYLQVVRSSKVWSSRKSVARRFVPGNTAFKRMSGLPMLPVAQMATATVSEREALCLPLVLSCV